MEFSKRESGSILILDINGEIDVYNAGELKVTLMETIDKGGKHIILNMKRVSYIDSTGIGVLLWALPALKQIHGDLKLICISDSIRKVFTLTGLLKFFEIFENEEAAAESFRMNSP